MNENSIAYAQTFAWDSIVKKLIKLFEKMID